MIKARSGNKSNQCECVLRRKWRYLDWSIQGREESKEG